MSAGQGYYHPISSTKFLIFFSAHKFIPVPRKSSAKNLAIIFPSSYSLLTPETDPRGVSQNGESID
ncbi:MAG TPA: hypothetical protein VF857_11725, partial [Spirochaetota bacterium]